MDRVPKPVLIAGIVVVAVVIYLIASASKAKTIAPATTQQGTGSNQNGASTFDIANLLSSNTQQLQTSISAVQSQIAAMPAGATNDQLNAALNNLQSALEASQSSNDANTIATVQQAIAQSQQALTTAMQDNTSTLSQAQTQNLQTLQGNLSDYQNQLLTAISNAAQQDIAAVTSGFSGQQTYLSQQFAALTQQFQSVLSLLPSLHTTSYFNDPHTLFEALQTNGYWDAQKAGNNLLASQLFEQGIKQAYPGLQNVDFATINDWYNNTFSGLLNKQGANFSWGQPDRATLTNALTSFFTQMINQGYARNAG